MIKTSELGFKSKISEFLTVFKVEEDWCLHRNYAELFDDKNPLVPV